MLCCHIYSQDFTLILWSLELRGSSLAVKSFRVGTKRVFLRVPVLWRCFRIYRVMHSEILRPGALVERAFDFWKER